METQTQKQQEKIEPQEKGKVIVRLTPTGKIMGSFTYKDQASKDKAIAKGIARVWFWLGDDVNPWECLFDAKGLRL